MQIHAAGNFFVKGMKKNQSEIEMLWLERCCYKKREICREAILSGVSEKKKGW
jgi:hypothetical protein